MDFKFKITCTLIAVLGLIIMFLLTGCSYAPDNNDIVNDNFTIYVDEETCIEYFIGTTNFAKTMFPRYDSDDTLKRNDECLERHTELKNIPRAVLY